MARQVLSGLVHERIICLLGACTVPPHLAIVEELAAGSLYAALHRLPDGSERTEPAPMPYPQARTPTLRSSFEPTHWCTQYRSRMVCLTYEPNPDSHGRQCLLSGSVAQ